MPHKLSSAAIEALRSTLQGVEEEWGLTPDDASLIELKRILLGRITELEAADEGRSSEEATAPAAAPAVLESGPTSGSAATTLALDLAVSLVARPSAGPAGEAERSEDQRNGSKAEREPEKR